MSGSSSNKAAGAAAAAAGKVAIVSGGSSGIGAGCVRVFVRHGVNVLFFSNDEDEGKQLEQQLSSQGPGRAKFVLADCTDDNALQSVVQQCMDEFKELHWLVNNVGCHPDHAGIDAFTPDDMRHLLNVNVVSAFTLTRLCLPHIRRVKGSIVNIGSTVASIGQLHAVTYVTSKAAIVGFTKALAIDEASAGVRVNCISPGSVDTPLLRANAAVAASSANSNSSSSYEAKIASYAEQAHLGRLATCDEVASACLFFFQDATFCTGAELQVSGGAELGYARKMRRC